MRVFSRFLVVSFIVVAAATASGEAAPADWVRLDQLPQSEFLSIYGGGNQLFAGGSGTIYSRGGCESLWEPSQVVSPSANHIAALIAVDGRLFAGVYYEGVFESTDGGASWVRRNSGLGGLGANVPLGFAVRGDSLYLATGGAGVFAMPLQGATTWTPYRDGLYSGFEWTINSLALVGNVLIAGAGANGTVSRRPAGMGAWETFEFSEFAGDALMMLALGANDGIIYGVATNGLYTSADSGKVWKQFLTNSGIIEDGAIAAAGKEVFAMTNRLGQGTKIYRRIQNTWALFDELPAISAWDMTIACNRIYLATMTGVWSRDLDATDVPEHGSVLPGQMRLEQNYPNPFNPSTVIAFSIGSQSSVNLSVYNILGQLVAILVAGEFMAGSYTVEWNGTGTSGELVPSGIYFYRLTAGSQTMTRKMVLVK